MITFAVPIAVQDIVSMQLVAFDILTGIMTITIFAGGVNPARRSYTFTLSNVAGASEGLGTNPSPPTWEQTVRVVTGVGVVNSLTAAGTTFFTTPGTIAQRSDAVLTQGTTNGWLQPAFL